MNTWWHIPASILIGFLAFGGPIILFLFARDVWSDWKYERWERSPEGQAERQKKRDAYFSQARKAAERAHRFDKMVKGD